MEADDVLTIAEVARRSGFAASALRYYESQGLLEADRSADGQRRFARGVLRRLAFIRAAGNVGLSLEEIRVELGRLPSARTPTVTDWQKITTSWRARLDEQIIALEDLRDGLDSCIGCGCLSLERCAISNPRDGASARGPGAVYLAPTLRRRPPASHAR